MPNHQVSLKSDVYLQLKSRKRNPGASFSDVIEDLLRRAPPSIRDEITEHITKIELLLVRNFDFDKETKDIIHTSLSNLGGWINRSIDDPKGFRSLSKAVCYLFERKSSKLAHEEEADEILSAHIEE